MASESAGAMDAIAGVLRSRLETSNLAREQALRWARETIQFSSRAIRAVHRGESDKAAAAVSEARNRVETIGSALATQPALLHAGYVHDAQKEYVEAEAMIAIVSAKPLPEPDRLGVEPAAYLNGMAEAASECRRYVLDRLRTGETAEGERVLEIMDDIYSELITFDFPDAITGGLRRTTDALRAVLERTRGDLTLTVAQRRLETALARTDRALSGATNPAQSPED